eukprot:1565880-Rhodomonas_salina.1
MALIASSSTRPAQASALSPRTLPCASRSAARCSLSLAGVTCADNVGVERARAGMAITCARAEREREHARRTCAGMQRATPNVRC